MLPRSGNTGPRGRAAPGRQPGVGDTTVRARVRRAAAGVPARRGAAARAAAERR